MMSSTRHDDESGVGVKGRPGAQGGEDDREEYVTSHPKMTKLKEVVLEHFEKFSTGEFKGYLLTLLPWNLF